MGMMWQSRCGQGIVVAVGGGGGGGGGVVWNFFFCLPCQRWTTSLWVTILMARDVCCCD